MNAVDTRPIGLFDSGVGGLTVLKAVSKLMPSEDLVYFGDTAHLPYGSKSPAAVTRFALAAAGFLVGKGIKALVVACNTSSALALPALKRRFRLPIVDVVGPAARAALGRARAGRVGVIATEATIASRAYPKALAAGRRGLSVRSRPCPLFVPLVEEGWWEDPVTEEVARRYLESFKEPRPEVMILGCTHYPLLKKTISRVLGRSVKLVDSGEEAALELRALLGARSLLGRTRGRGRWSFYVSDAPERFSRLSGRWLGPRATRARLWVPGE